VQSADKLCHPISVAYSAELVLLNKQQISGGGVVSTVTKKNFTENSVHLSFVSVNIHENSTLRVSALLHQTPNTVIRPSGHHAACLTVTGVIYACKLTQTSEW